MGRKVKRAVHLLSITAAVGSGLSCMHVPSLSVNQIKNVATTDVDGDTTQPRCITRLDDESSAMASPLSRIPVPAQHSRIPVLGPALSAAHPSGVATSSSTSFRAVRAVSDAATPSTASPMAPADHSSTAIGSSFDMLNNPNAEDQAWGKIERLRTRRVFSEGDGDLAAAPTTSSGSADDAPTFGYRPFSPGPRSNAVTTAAEPRNPTHGSTTHTFQSSSAVEQPLGSQRVASPQRHAQDKTRQPHRSPDYRNRSLPSESSAMLSRPTRDRRRIRIETALTSDDVDLHTTQADKTDQTVRPKLVSNVSIDGWGMLALGFESRNETAGSLRPVDPLVSEPQANGIRTNTTATLLGPISSTATDEAEPVLYVERPELPREAVTSREAGPDTTSQPLVSTQPRRRAFDIPRALPSLGTNVARDDTEMSTATSLGHHSPSEISVKPRIDPSDTGSNSQKSAAHEHFATTAEKRHQPQLRLASMPNIPTLRAPGVLQPPRRSGSGASPPIPPKSPLRQPSGFVASPTSQDSNSTTPGFLTPNSVFATPSEIPEPAILDKPPDATFETQSHTASADSPSFEQKRKETTRHRPEGFYLASSETADIYQQISEFGQGKSVRSSASATGPDDTLQLSFGSLKGTSSVISVR